MKRILNLLVIILFVLAISPPGELVKKEVKTDISYCQNVDQQIFLPAIIPNTLLSYQEVGISPGEISYLTLINYNEFSQCLTGTNDNYINVSIRNNYKSKSVYREAELQRNYGNIPLTSLILIT
jgi:hypothetical protein